MTTELEKKWVQLSPEIAHAFYRVPKDVAEADGNAFFELEKPNDPWPLVAFIQNRMHPGIVTFHILTVISEALEYGGFNPLNDASGCSLTRRELAGLARLLRAFARRLPPGARGYHKMFEELHDCHLEGFRILAEYGVEQRRKCYHQLYDPMVDSEEKKHTLVLLSSGTATSHPLNMRPISLRIKLSHFPDYALVDPSFKPPFDALSRINLDRGGMEELADLLKEQLVHLREWR